MSKPMTGAPLGSVRRVRRRVDTVRGLLAGLLMLAILVGVPVALVGIVGNPIPKLPAGGLSSGRVSVRFVLDVIVCIVWLAWAQLAACLVSELVAGVRGRGLPWRVPFAAASQQELARRLVTAVLMIATAAHGLHSAPAPPRPADRPAATAALVGGAVAGVSDRSPGAGAAVAPAGKLLRAAPATGRPVREYIVMPPQGQHHDSLWDIADRHLGSGLRYKEIFELNEGRLQPDGERLTLDSLIRPGWTLVLPADARGDGLIEITPGQPGQPSPLGQPSPAGQLSQAGQPGQPGEPGQPGRLSQPGEAGQPGERGQPAQSGDMPAAAQRAGAAHAGGPPAGATRSGPPHAATRPGDRPAAATAATAGLGAAATAGPGAVAPAAPAIRPGQPATRPGPGQPGQPGQAAQPGQPGPLGQATQLGQVGPPGQAAPPGAAGRSGLPGPGGQPAGSIPWDVVGAELLAAGVLEALVTLRRRRARGRPPGSGVVLPDSEAAAVEVAVRLGADPDAAEFLDRALRALATGLAAQDRPVPEVYAGRLSPDALELLLAVPAENAPAPFLAESGGARWVLERTVPLPPTRSGPGAAAAAPLPGLVSVGGDGYGRVFVDLEAAGGAICVEGDLDQARSVVAAMAVELVTNRWSDDMRVTLVGFGSALAPISEQRLRCVERIDDVLEGVTDRLSASRQELAASGLDSVLTGRVKGLRQAGVTPDFLVFAAAPDPAQLAEVTDWARATSRAPLGVLIAGSVPVARWRFRIDEDGILDTGVLGVRVGAQLLTARSFAALARLLQAEAAAAAVDQETARLSAETVRAMAAGLPVPRRPDDAPGVRPVLSRPVDLGRAPEVLVRLFGEPDVTAGGAGSWGGAGGAGNGGGTDGAGNGGGTGGAGSGGRAGEALPPGPPQSVEIVAFVALAGAVSPRALAAAVWPYGVTEAERDATLTRVRAWLGADAHGRPRLRLDEDGNLRLADEVQLDWHLFVALSAGPAEADALRALELARGPLAEPRPVRRYTWLARDRIAHELPAYTVDVAHRLACSYLSRREYEGAAATARAGLRVQPVAGVLWDDLEAAAGERDGAAGAAAIRDERSAALASWQPPRPRRQHQLTA